MSIGTQKVVDIDSLPSLECGMPWRQWPWSRARKKKAMTPTTGCGAPPALLYHNDCQTCPASNWLHLISGALPIRWLQDLKTTPHDFFIATMTQLTLAISKSKLEDLLAPQVLSAISLMPNSNNFICMLKTTVKLSQRWKWQNNIHQHNLKSHTPKTKNI